MPEKYFRKFYNHINLLGSEQDILERIEFINKYSPLISGLAKTSISKKGDKYEYKQSFINKKSFRQHNKSFLINKLNSLATHLTQMMDFGYVHGDLNIKNILFDGEKFIIIDLEPSLFQIKNKRKMLMMTPPYWSFNDIQNNTVSTESDKIGFYCFCSKILDNNFFIKDRVNLTIKRQKELVQFLPINENEMVLMGYHDLLLHARKENLKQ